MIKVLSDFGPPSIYPSLNVTLSLLSMHTTARCTHFTYEQVLSDSNPPLIYPSLNVTLTLLPMPTHIPLTKGSCGASWAFASVEQIESDAMRAGVLERSQLMAKLSYQQAISCYTESGQMGCSGGYNWYTYENVISTGGISLQQNYPYVSGTTGQSETCNKASSVTSSVSVTQGRYYYNQEIKMQQYLLTTGPLTAHVSAKTWNTYVSGTMSTAGCSGWVDYRY